VEVGRVRLDVEDAGQQLLVAAGRFQRAIGQVLVGRVVVFGQFLQHEPRTVVELHLGLVVVLVHGDLLVGGDEVQLVELNLILLAPGVALGRVVVVVEGDARADHVEDRQALVAERGFEQRLELFGVAGKAARDKGGVGGQRLQADIQRHEGVDACVLEHLALVGGGAELALGQAVDAVVLHDVDHGQVAPHQVLETADADGGGVAVAADADAGEGAVGDERAGGHGGHAPVQVVEAVAHPQEIGRRLAAAADAGELDHLGLFQPDLPGCIDDAGADRVVAAAVAQGGIAALVGRLFHADCVQFGRLGRRCACWCCSHKFIVLFWLLSGQSLDFIGNRFISRKAAKSHLLLASLRLCVRFSIAERVC
jgi:hypothetical protein